MKLLLMGDVHARRQSPEMRAGDYFADINDKLDQITSLVHGHDIDVIIQPGDLFDSSRRKRQKEILQALIYSILYRNSKEDDIHLLPALYPTRIMGSGTFDPRVKWNRQYVNNVEMLAKEVLPELQGKLAEIFDFEKDFEQTDNENTCKYCPFKDYCQR